MIYIVYGKSLQGKTSFCFSILKYLDQKSIKNNKIFIKTKDILYICCDSLMNISSRKNIDFLKILNHFLLKLKSENFKIVLIDLFQFPGMNFVFEAIPNHTKILIHNFEVYINFVKKNECKNYENLLNLNYNSKNLNLKNSQDVTENIYTHYLPVIQELIDNPCN